MKKEASRSLAIEVVKSVKEALDDYGRDDIQYALSAIDNFVLGTKGTENRSYSKARKALLPLRNTLCGALDADNHRSLSNVMTKYEDRMTRDLENFVVEYKTAIKSLSVRNTPKAKNDESEEAHDKLRHEFVKDRDVTMLQDHLELLKTLPKEVDEGFEIVETSVLPSFNKLVKLDVPLARAGIKYDKLDIYYILKNQMLIAFDGQSVRGSERTAFVRECLDVMNESGNIQYELVCDYYAPGPGAGKVAYAWIMDKRKFSRLYESAGTFSVKLWSFPTMTNKNPSASKPKVKPKVQQKPQVKPKSKLSNDLVIM